MNTNTIFTALDKLISWQEKYNIPSNTATRVLLHLYNKPNNTDRASVLAEELDILNTTFIYLCNKMQDNELILRGDGSGNATLTHKGIAAVYELLN